MKRFVFLLLVLLAVAAPITAQQPPGVPPTPEAQALAQKLMGEINANIACSTNVITLQQQLAAAQAKIKSLEEKAVPNKDAPK